ncbi:MAG: ABC transporter ATP-binding protein [Flavobacteriaceae bacterium]|nr:ABC transporter ATP-binding protein [Flavobacteriaceae bacterium]
MNNNSILNIKNLTISFGNKKSNDEVVHGISLHINKNEILGVVGESGSGKSVTAMTILGLLPKKNTFLEGEILFNKKDLLKDSKNNIRKLRGNNIAMIFQEPMTALNPSLTCGNQVSEIIRHHLNHSISKAKKETISLFEKVKLPRSRELYNSYPHQISGGQMQRVIIAMAIACKPKLLIADEPTTALDVTVQKEIMLLLKEIQKETKMSMLFISHDLELVSEIADRVIVMHKGDIVEEGSALQVFKMPKEDYTKALMASRPSLDVRLKVLPTVASLTEKSFKPIEVTSQERALKHKYIYTKKPLLEILNVKKEYYFNAGFFNKKKIVNVVNGVSFKIFEGETLGLVGESGCGKSTLGKAILQLEKATSGSIKYRGKELTKLKTSELRKFRKEIQLIFQDPYSSLNPRMLIGEAIMEPMKVYRIGKNDGERKSKVLRILNRVELDDSYFNRYPHELSGGQRQRIGIARTIAMEPKLVVCDESVSALDISVQAQVFNLLNELKDDFSFTYIFISHDLAVVKFMADQLLVMKDGKIEEIGDADEIYANPTKEYTQKLIKAIPKGI